MRRHAFRLRARPTTAAHQRDPRLRCSRRRSAGGADETRQRNELILRHDRFVGSDEEGGFPANIATSEASH